MDNVHFGLIYRQHYNKVIKLSKAFARTTGIDQLEFKSLLNEEFFLAIRDYDSSKSSNLPMWLNQRLKARAIDFAKSKYASESKRWVFYESTSLSNKADDDDDQGSLELTNYVSTEDDVIKRQEIKTDADKRQLINVLTINCDSLTTAIVNEFLNCTSSERPTPTAIGKKLGIHHEKVKRALRKLAKRYDERQFGSIDAYLAV